MRRAGGYAVIVSPDDATLSFERGSQEHITAGTHEYDTFGCKHCGRVVHVKARVSMDEFGSMCRNCMGMVCKVCADGPCVPFEKKLEMAEARDRALRSYGV